MQTPGPNGAGLTAGVSLRGQEDAAAFQCLKLQQPKGPLFLEISSRYKNICFTSGLGQSPSVHGHQREGTGLAVGVLGVGVRWGAGLSAGPRAGRAEAGLIHLQASFRREHWRRLQPLYCTSWGLCLTKRDQFPPRSGGAGGAPAGPLIRLGDNSLPQGSSLYFCWRISISLCRRFTHTVSGTRERTRVPAKSAFPERCRLHDPSPDKLPAGPRFAVSLGPGAFLF